MARREQNINRKLQLQKSQIRSILSDFRKAKQKCISLSQELDVELSQKPQLQALEKQILIKIDLLDVPGLAALKNRLKQSISKLYDMQSDLSIQKERIAARNQFNKMVNASANSNKNITKQSKIPNDNQGTKHQNKPKQSTDKKIMQKDKVAKTSDQVQQPKQSGFNVPLYHIMQDTSENKLQRILRYVASLKSKQQKELGNMKIHAQDRGQEKINQILNQLPEFIALKKQVQKVKKQKEQLQAKLKQVSKKAIQDYINSSELVQQAQNYMIVKIPKNQKSKFNFKIKMAEKQSQIRQDSKLHNAINNNTQAQSKKLQQVAPESVPPRRLKIIEFQQQLQALKSKPKDADILQIQRQLQKQQYNVESVVSRINSTLQNNEEKLRHLREKRMKIFEKQQEIWSEFQQL